MCGRLTLTSGPSTLQLRFTFRGEGLPYAPRYNIAPAQEVLTVVNGGGNRAQLMRWGLVPSWAKDPSVGQRMINARAETVAEKRAFRAAFRRRRCLVLADGFYEWKRQAERKVPMYIALKARAPFAFAGLWETWAAPQGELVYSCAIITTAANAFMEPIHGRMPVILSREGESAWLDSTLDDPATLVSLLVPYRGDDLEAYPVSLFVNSTKNDSPACLTRMA